MSIYGLAKGTQFEQMVKKIAQAEANGVMMYYALARLAKEQGYEDIAPLFVEAGNQEAEHAGFYSLMAGRYPQDFWGLIRTLEKAERCGEHQIKALADQVRAAGMAEAADIMEEFAKQEGHHGEVMASILAKYPEKAKASAPSGGKVYVCPVCGYEHEGDMDSEPEDYVCPLCGQPKHVFQEKK